MPERNFTTISISIELHEYLKKQRQRKENFDELLRRLIPHTESKFPIEYKE